MTILEITLAEWSAGGGGSIALVIDDVAKTVNQIKIRNGSVVVRGEIVLDGITRGAILQPNIDQTIPLQTPRPYTEIPLARGDVGYDFGVTRVSIGR